MKRYALVIIGHFKPEWTQLAEDEQAAFVSGVSRAAKEVGVTAVVGYTLSTPGSFLQVWEAADKPTLESFKQKLDALGSKKYYDEVLMAGERSAEWIQGAAQPTEQADS
jgi:hypothetical protein